MSNQQLVNSPLNRRESNNGCYVADNKGLSNHNRNTKSALNPPNSASDSGRRRREIRPFADRFWARVRKTRTCWLWTGSLTPDGYGQIATASYRAPAATHRASWELHRGPIPVGAHVLHRCDVRHCVNPNHLFLGDQDANMKDAAAKGRLHVARPNRRRLSNDEMAAILAEPQVRGVVVRLARQYGVTKAYVSLLRRGLRRWRKAA